MVFHSRSIGSRISLASSSCRSRRGQTSHLRIVFARYNGLPRRNPSSCSTFIALPPVQLLRKAPDEQARHRSGSFWVKVCMGMSTRSVPSLYDITAR
jgi:hypothetical protein